MTGWNGTAEGAFPGPLTGSIRMSGVLLRPMGDGGKVGFCVTPGGTEDTAPPAEAPETAEGRDAAVEVAVPPALPAILLPVAPADPACPADPPAVEAARAAEAAEAEDGARFCAEEPAAADAVDPPDPPLVRALADAPEFLLPLEPADVPEPADPAVARELAAGADAPMDDCRDELRDDSEDRELCLADAEDSAECVQGRTPLQQTVPITDGRLLELPALAMQYVVLR